MYIRNQINLALWTLPRTLYPSRMCLWMKSYGIERKNSIYSTMYKAIEQIKDKKHQQQIKEVLESSTYITLMRPWLCIHYLFRDNFFMPEFFLNSLLKRILNRCKEWTVNGARLHGNAGHCYFFCQTIDSKPIITLIM